MSTRSLDTLPLITEVSVVVSTVVGESGRLSLLFEYFDSSVCETLWKSGLYRTSSSRMSWDLEAFDSELSLEISSAADISESICSATLSAVTESLSNDFDLGDS
eukprot:NODE_492_length_7766_cov_0.167210.p5 type:complete len:104 gc:universal NODE_492_length_7766_cov_0.167210:3517-3206(-)